MWSFRVILYPAAQLSTEAELGWATCKPLQNASPGHWQNLFLKEPASSIKIRKIHLPPLNTEWSPAAGAWLRSCTVRASGSHQGRNPDLTSMALLPLHTSCPPLIQGQKPHGPTTAPFLREHLTCRLHKHSAFKLWKMEVQKRGAASFELFVVCGGKMTCLRKRSFKNENVS